MYLSGLTCTHENVMTKAGAQEAAAQVGVAFIAPDTSPRGLGVEGEDDSYDFGTGSFATLLLFLSSHSEIHMPENAAIDTAALTS